MLPKSKKRGLLRRFVSFFGNRGNESAVDPHQDSHKLVYAGAKPFGSAHASACSAPGLSLPAENSNPQRLELQAPIRHFESQNTLAEPSQWTATPTSGNQDFLRPPQSQPFQAQQPYNNLVAPESRTPYSGTSFLAGANRFRMRDVQYNHQVNVHTGRDAGDGSIDGWGFLSKSIAPNALHNSRARFDAPRCDEDTRVEVTGEIMDWIQDRSAPQRILCMTGAAGAGKSALQQTIAVCCVKTDILGAAFFFSSADPTRNTASTVVGTIAYQLGLKHPLFRRAIAAAVKHDPLIFSQSIESQMESLIALPFKNIRRSGEIDIGTFPYVILIDGLDECKCETRDTSNPTHLDVGDRCRAEDRQAELLAAIKRCVLDNDLPFRFLVASRPEWAIRTALEPGGHLHQVAYHIQLSDKYDASADMYRYLRRRFEAIGLRIGNSQWFTEANINTLVEGASGQFIYVATLYKYISERRAFPEERLKLVLSWKPHGCQRARPFETLDNIYTNILLAAKDAYEAVDTNHGCDFLLLFGAHHINAANSLFGPGDSKTFPADVLSALLCLEPRAEESLISDLRSLVTLETDEHGSLCLRLYHKSFSDFLEAEGRAKDLFVSRSRVETHFAKCLLQYIIECPLDFDFLPAKWEELPLPVLYRRSLMEAVRSLPWFLRRVTTIDGEIKDFTQNGGWQKMNSLIPLLYDVGAWRLGYFGCWIDWLREFAHSLETRRGPDVAAVISEFGEKWEYRREEWAREMAKWDPI